MRSYWSTSERSTSEWSTYRRVTRTATYGFLAALPLVLMYELLVVFANRGAVAQVRVGAEVWLKQLLAVIGNTGFAALGVVILLVGAAVFWFERRKRIPLRVRYFGWMVLESALYAVLTALLVSGLVGAILSSLYQAVPAAAVQGAVQSALPGAVQRALPGGEVVASGGLLLQLALSVGAGVYEELLFRVLLVGGLFLGLRRLTQGRAAPYAVAAVIGAFLFSLVHYIGPLGDVLEIGSFLFRFIFGLVLNVLFLARGFGIAAWTHALYDVMVVVALSG